MFSPLFKWLGKTRPGFYRAMNVAIKAAPYVDIAMQIVTTLTPSGADDLAWAFIRDTFPHVFEPKLTVEERKLYMLAVAGELLQRDYPDLTITAARLAVQTAYLQQKTESKQSQAVNDSNRRIR